MSFWMLFILTPHDGGIELWVRLDLTTCLIEILVQYKEVFKLVLYTGPILCSAESL